MRFQVLAFLAFFLFLECNSLQEKEGVVRVNTSFVGDGEKSNSLPPFEIDFKILYKGNLSIQEVPVLNLTEDSSGKESSVKIKHYSYLDPDINRCLNYKTFSDTAKVWKHYTDIDSIEVDGGWNFLSNKKLEYDSSANLPDTIVNGVTYGRRRLYDRRSAKDLYFNLYIDCNRKSELIRIFKTISDSLGCPIVRQETYIKGKIFIVREIDFLSDRLSPAESQVFSAWGKNANSIR